MRDKTSTVASLTDDILNEVEQSEQREKVASEDVYTPSTKLASQLFKLASDCRDQAGKQEITYEDLHHFQEKMAGEA